MKKVLQKYSLFNSFCDMDTNIGNTNTVRQFCCGMKVYFSN